MLYLSTSPNWCFYTTWFHVYRSVQSVITADNFTPAKRDESFSAMFTEP